MTWVLPGFSPRVSGSLLSGGEGVIKFACKLYSIRINLFLVVENTFNFYY
jgi:hypothetical protein